MTLKSRHASWKYIACYLTLLPLLLDTNYSHADSSRSAVIITGSITQPTCKINAGGQINIYFNSVDITQIKTGLYKKEIPLTITCGSQPAPISLSLKAAPGFDPSFIGTSVEGLAIKITRNALIWRPNINYPSTTSQKNNIEATLILQAGKEQEFLSSGINSKDKDFTASVTLSASYY